VSDPELFVVRVWRQLASGFHASVRRVDQEQTHHFSQPSEIARFLSEATTTDSAARPAGDPIAAPDPGS
jgi:hypothetical protein